MDAENPVYIRPARLSDAQSIAHLLGVEIALIESRLRYTEKRWDAYSLLVAESQHPPRLIGTGYLRPWMRIAEISDVMIHPAYRQQGIAYQLMQELIKVAKAHGYPALQLTCAMTNIPALHLYHKAGFSIKRQIQLDEGTLYLMECVLV